MSAIPKFTIQQLLEVGAHFGHKSNRWNPRMAPYIFGERDGIHIMNLQLTAPLLHQSLKLIYDVTMRNGRILFVGTKFQAQEPIADAAQRCGQYYVNHRWLGGMLTNWNTVSASIGTLRKTEEQLENPHANLTKKERLQLERQQEKLTRSLGGIREMGGTPDLLVIIDTNREHLAIKEAEKLGIPVVAILDSNSNPEGISHPIPANDDSARAIKLYLRLFSDTILAGIQAGLSASGADLGEAAEPEKTKVTTSKVVKGKDDKLTIKVDAKEEKEAAKPEAKEEKKAPAKKAPAKKAAEKKEPAAKKTDAKATTAKAKEAKAEEKAPAKKPAAKKPAAKKTATKASTEDKK